MLLNKRSEIDLFCRIETQPQLVPVQLLTLGRKRFGGQDKAEFLIQGKRIALETTTAATLNDPPYPALEK